MTEVSYDIAPNAKGSLENLLHQGTTLMSSIAEILDNAVTAKANNIKLSVIHRDGKWYLLFIDDGIGMDKNKLYSIQESHQKSAGTMEGFRCTYKGAGRFGVGYAAARAYLTENSGNTVILSHYKDTPANISDDQMYELLGFAKCEVELNMELERGFMKVSPDQDLGDHSSNWTKYAIDPRKTGTIFMFPITNDIYERLKKNLFNESLCENIALQIADRYTPFLNGEYLTGKRGKRKGVSGEGETKGNDEEDKLNITISLEDEDGCVLKEVNIDPIPSDKDFKQENNDDFKRNFTFISLKESILCETTINKSKVIAHSEMAIHDKKNDKYSIILEAENIGSKGKVKKLSKKLQHDWVELNMEDSELLKVTSLHINNIENYIDYLRACHENLGIKVPMCPLTKDQRGRLVAYTKYPIEELFRPKLTRNGYRLTLEKREKADQTHEKFRLHTKYDYSFEATKKRDNAIGTETNKMRTSRNTMDYCIRAGMYQTEANSVEGVLKIWYSKNQKEETITSSDEKALDNTSEISDEDQGFADNDFLLGQDIASHEDDLSAIQNTKPKKVKFQKVRVNNIQFSINEMAKSAPESKLDDSEREDDEAPESKSDDSEREDDEAPESKSDDSEREDDESSDEEVGEVKINDKTRVVDEYIADEGLIKAEYLQVLTEVEKLWEAYDLESSEKFVDHALNLTNVYMDLMCRFVISKGCESFYKKLYKRSPLGIKNLLESIRMIIEEYCTDDVRQNVKAGATLKRLYKGLQDEIAFNCEEEYKHD